MSTYIGVLFKKHKKHLPPRLESTWVGGFLRYGFMIFVSAWILQGMRIMNNKERAIKIVFDVILMAIFIVCGLHWVAAFVIAHTMNFIFNGQFHAMFTHMGATGCSAQDFLQRTIWIRRKISSKSFINAAIAYGSLSRGCYKKTSDIDLRLIPASGTWNGWTCAMYALWLRTMAFYVRYPLDMYVYSPEVVVKKMRTDELPIMIHEKNKCMQRWYPRRVEFEDFIDVFTKNNLSDG